jgi:hypothetical protein
MSYVKIVDFSTKNALVTGQALNRVNATEIDNELNAIAAASVASDAAIVAGDALKANLAGGNTFTGTQAMGALTVTTINGHTLTAGSSTFTGTAGQTYTFPTTSATLARIDAANTFTGTQTFGVVSATSITGLSTPLSVAQGGTGLAAPGTAGNVLTSNGTAWESTAPSDSGIRDISRNLVVNNTVANPNFQIDITADELMLNNGSGGVYLASAVSETVDITASGASGLDTGAEANSTWYYLWIIYNGTTVNALLSTSSTAPTMPTIPSAYTYKALVGAVYNNSSGHFISLYQLGNKVRIVPITDVSAATDVAYAAKTLTVPPTAKLAQVNAQVFGSSGAADILAIWLASDSGGTGEVKMGVNSGGSSTPDGGIVTDVMLKTPQTIYSKWSTSGGSVGGIYIYTTGWEY